MKDLKIPKVIFKIREGDLSEYPDACAIGGKWTNKSTNDFFFKKRIVLFSLPVHSLQLVHLNNYLALKKIMKKLSPQALMKFTVVQ